MSDFKKSIKKIKYSLLVIIARILLVVIRLLPRTVAMKLLGSLGAVVFWVMKEERTKAISNLNIAYGQEKSQAEIHAMAKEVFVNLGKSGAEFAIKMSQNNPEKFFENLEVRGDEHLQEAIKKGKGILGLISHMGCWEGTALGLPMLGIPAYAIG